jgi:uncharacterized paraquat-inducible protein A
MLLRRKCPGCGDLKEYLAEEVGTTADCFRCGQRFTLQPNNGRAAWQIITATMAVLLLISGIAARVYLRAKRAENRHNTVRTFMERQTATPSDERDGD